MNNEMYYCIKCTYYTTGLKCGVRHIFISNPSTCCCQYFRVRSTPVVTIDYREVARRRKKGKKGGGGGEGNGDSTDT